MMEAAQSQPAIGVIFDMDGVLVLTESAHWASWLEVARWRGAELSHAAFKSCFGQLNPDCIRVLFGPLPAAEAAAIAEEKEAAFRRIVRAEVPLVPGIERLLSALSERGVRLGIGSSGPPENVKALLEGGGIARFFDVTVDGAQVQRGKPAPDVFLLGAQRLGVGPAGCAVIEDAPVGIRAAVAAGMVAIGVATTHPEADLREAGAEHVFPGPAVIDPEWLVGLLRVRAAARP